MKARTPFIIALCIMHCALCISLADPAVWDHGTHFSDEEHIALDLGGKTREGEAG